MERRIVRNGFGIQPVETRDAGHIAEGRISNSSYERDGETVYSTDLVATTFNAFQTPNNSKD